MRISIGISVIVLLLFCVSTSAFVGKRAVQSVSRGEQALFNSLEPNQQKWWTENRQKLFDAVVDAATDASDDAVEEIEEFVKALTPTQQELWYKLQSKANRVVNKYMASGRTHCPTAEFNRRAVCEGRCILSKQCVDWSGNGDCRRTWFSCQQY